MLVPLDPQAMSCTLRSRPRSCRATSRALRPYSRDCSWPFAPLRAAIDVAVLGIGDRHLRGAGAEVHPQQRLGPDRATPVDEIVGAELIRLDRVPRPFEHRRPLRLRANAVEPVVAGHEVAARVASDRNAKLLHLADDVAAESLRISEA